MTPEQAANTIREFLQWHHKEPGACRLPYAACSCTALAALKVLEDAATESLRWHRERDEIERDHEHTWDRLVEARKREAEAVARADTLTQALREVEKNCPCGARPESPNTHPHVLGCPVGLALGSPSVADNYAKAIYGSSLAEEDDDD